MKKRYLGLLLIIALFITCITQSSENSVETTSPSPPEANEVRPGVYATNDLNSVPLPTSGYDIYLIGEEHGIRETKLLFVEYLKILHETIGLRDVIIETPQAHEKKLNKYIRGYNEGEYGVLIDGIKTLNDTLSTNEQIRIHTIDVDWSISQIYEHLHQVKEEGGPSTASVELPPLGTFDRWSEDEMMVVTEQLLNNAENKSLENELETIKTSIKVVFFLRECRGTWKSIREELLVRNTQHVLNELNGAPLLGFFGIVHVQKCQAMSFQSMYGSPLGQLLEQSGINVYSLGTLAVQGYKTHQSTGEPVPVYTDPHYIQFSDGTTMAQILEDVPEYSIVYVDLRREHASARLGDGSFLSDFNNVPAGNIFDGIVVFREVTPQ